MCPLRVFLILFSALVAIGSLLWSLAKDQEERDRGLKVTTPPLLHCDAFKEARSD
jgi:hypothetical protein